MRQSIPKATQLKIWNRDHWTCRYCGEPVFFAPTLKLLNETSPGHGYYHPNGKADSILALFQWRWASIDHVMPHSAGGADDETNYTTACWECNLKLNDATYEKGKPKPDKENENAKCVNWDGMSSLYPKLVEKEDDWTKLIL